MITYITPYLAFLLYSYMTYSAINLWCKHLRCCYYFIQLEQEIDLILEKKGAFASALQDWSTKWVPAILEYSNTVAGKKAALLSATRKVYEGIIHFIEYHTSDLY